MSRRETNAQVDRRWARAIIRLIHPTVPPSVGDVDRVAYAVSMIRKEVKQRARVVKRNHPKEGK